MSTSAAKAARPKATAESPIQRAARAAAAPQPDQRPATVAQRKLQADISSSPRVQQSAAPAQRQENNTGLPDTLKAGVENLSGHALDDVRVHYNSAQPAQLQAHAYAQGSDIHVAPGQEQHLPHEAWHVAQQKQGRVKPTRQLKGKTALNDDAGLEKEADVMGARAAVQRQAVADLSNETGLVAHQPAGEPQGRIVEKAPRKISRSQGVGTLQTHKQAAGNGSLTIPIQRAGNETIQLLKKGDLAELAAFGLDLDSWDEFTRIIEKSGLHMLTMLSHRLDTMPINEETFRARQIVEVQKRKIRKPSPNLVDFYFGGESGAAGTAIGSSEQGVEINKVRISNTSKEVDVEKAMAFNKNLGTINARLTDEEAQKLKSVIKVISEASGLTSGLEDMSDSLDALLEKNQPEEEEEEEEEEEHKEAPTRTVEGFKTPREIDEERRRIADAFRWSDFPNESSGRRKIGVHETSSENALSLIRSGPSAAKLGTGRGQGKGPGFYVSPVGNKTLYNATKDVIYGEQFVAIYIPNDFVEIRSLSSATDHTDQLDELHNSPARCYYVMSGGGEIVIPVRCFAHIKPVTALEQLAINSHTTTAAIVTTADTLD